MISKIIILGTGNVATNFVCALKGTDVKVAQIYDRHIEKAGKLAKEINAEAISSIKDIDTDIDACFFMLSDTGIIETVGQMKKNNKILVHTAGSLSMNIFKSKTDNFGVFYPFQTFTKEMPIDFSNVPACLEASNRATFNFLKEIAEKLKCKVYEINEEKRQYLHLSGVFACNFMNHCIFLGNKVLEDHGIDREIIKPLLEQSFKKILAIGAEKSQTGPAKRNDKVIIDKHLELLKDDKRMSDIYKILTESIMNFNI
ncbi:MAG: DUF2520 domain-containing protein [Bacteroidales bacterium]|jgi:predicted short-subunit dehydrogenase-like oxidoreductase (DUF2520 family)|nr:DUF2520 domain-containing protein [Bacteroidales bacterium]